MAEDFDTMLSDAIDLAVSAAHPAGASAARIRGRKRTVRKRVAVSTVSLVLVAAGTTAAFAAASSAGGGTPHMVAASPRVTSSRVTSLRSATASPSTAASHGSHCGSGDLRVQEGRTESAASHDGVFLVFTNESGRTCTVQGNPAVVVAGASGVLVTAKPVLNGFLGPRETPGGPKLIDYPLVTLAPGASALALLEVEADTGQACYAVGSGTLRVTAPDATEAVSLGGTYTVGGAESCSNLEINPMITDVGAGGTGGTGGTG